MKRSRVRASLALAALCALLAPGLARAACGQLTLGTASAVTWQGATGAGYDVFDASDRLQALTLTVQKSGGGTCSYAIGMTEGNSGVFDPRELTRSTFSLPYNLYDTVAHSSIVKDAPAGPLLSGSFSNNAAFTETATLTYYWLIPAGQIVSGSTTQYTDRPTIFLYENVNGTLVQRASRKRRYRATVPKVVELSLVNTGAAFSSTDIAQTLDFGIFFTGQQLAFDLRARGNTPFDVTLQSQYLGVMKHTTLNSKVPYTLTVSGSAVTLTSGNAIKVASFTGDTTTAQGIAYPINVTVGSLLGTLGGLHRDHITVSLIAQ